jgi:uncharacterized SAM-binding protein YcdF (DUF218 family)
VVGGSELAQWLASRRAPRRRAGPGGSLAVIVLGFPTPRRGGVHPMQRFRARIGARTLAHAPNGNGVLVFTGGPTRGAARSEASVMAAYAVEALGVAADQVRIEPEARSTWENVRNSLPLADGADRIAIASDPLHAARGRRYLVAQRPDLAPRLVGAADYRLFEQWWLKTPSAIYEAVVAALGALRPALVKRGWA